ncbi:MAG: prepilin-type N-terminal cleavage/methylation domain-containing protein [Gemmatimonadaceae bacterium]|jgi:prepilin-type N-terminal cleavage/methylation domain-containing protein|nr:prepilin-type N-terminal cleavage/methylation domain-containing protein [Gemmatimonadaceae bacterium]
MSLRLRSRRPGVTLLELLVVLVLLSLAGALVVPALRSGVGPSADASPGPFDTARGLAARRGETMRVEVAADGRWAVRALRDTTVTPLAAGAASDDAAAPRPGDIAGAWIVSPLGLCVPVPGGAAPHASAAWNPVQCAPAR